jgi:hypothetical protein
MTDDKTQQPSRDSGELALVEKLAQPAQPPSKDDPVPPPRHAPVGRMPLFRR